MGRFKAISREVFYARDPIVRIGRGDIAALKRKALKNRKKKARICTHKDVKDPLHEMIIVHAKGTYVRPHKHRWKCESFHVIEGRLRVVIFDDAGKVSTSIDMSGYNTGKTFYYRLSKERFHTVIIMSDIAVFHETTSGPFDRAATISAPWAPADDEPKKAEHYLKGLVRRSKPETKRI